MGRIAWREIILAGWPVLSVLLMGSVISLAVMFERWRLFKQTNKNSSPFIDSIRRTSDSQQIVSFCERSDQPLALLASSIFKAPPRREDRERVLQRTIQSLVQKFEMHIPILGTIASVAPFVGLLGTVIGIIKAFQAVSMTATGGAGIVASGIAEALVGTAGGLVVAIPALLGYNYFANQLRRFTQDWEIAGGEIVDLSLEREKVNS